MVLVLNKKHMSINFFSENAGWQQCYVHTDLGAHNISKNNLIWHKTVNANQIKDVFIHGLIFVNPFHFDTFPVS